MKRVYCVQKEGINRFVEGWVMQDNLDFNIENIDKRMMFNSWDDARKYLFSNNMDDNFLYEIKEFYINE